MAKTNIEDIDRNIYDIKNKDNYEFKMQKGLNKEIVEEISKKKNEPEWMRDMPVREIATTLNLSYKNTENRLSFARKRVRDFVTKALAS